MRVGRDWQAASSCVAAVLRDEGLGLAVAAGDARARASK